MKKGTILVYHSSVSRLNLTRYEVIKAGKKNITLEPLHGQVQLIGFPTMRNAFNISVTDLNNAITEGIYTINQ